MRVRRDGECGGVVPRRRPPHELETFSRGGRQVEPERIRKGDPAWERWRLHNAANVQHLLDRLPPGALDATRRGSRTRSRGSRLRAVPADALRDVGGFGFSADLPPNLRGEDVVTQLQVAETAGGAGLLPSGAWHLELPTSIEDRSVDAYARCSRTDDVEAP